MKKQQLPWEKFEGNMLVPIKSWCKDLEEGAMVQAMNITQLPFIFKHFALMPDAHQGYGMPIGGVAACVDVVVPNMVGVDIGCGMGAIQTSIRADAVTKEQVDKIVDIIHRKIPAGEGHAHIEAQEWIGFLDYIAMIESVPEWFEKDVRSRVWDLAMLNLGTLGGGNHFIEIQRGDDGFLWFMLHSGSRNLGHKIATYYHDYAVKHCKKWFSNIPTDELAFLPVDSKVGKEYLRDMNFALLYAAESRKRMMDSVKYIAMNILGGFDVVQEVNIHHNYAALENHFGQNVWVHRKGATSARAGQIGIIPGSMGSSSYIVRGLGNIWSFQSCSHGAGRKLGRKDASRTLTLEECEKSMNGISFRGFQKTKRRKAKDPEWDLGEAPGAYKSIDAVMKAQSELVEIVVKLEPLGVVKG